jgi:3-oxoacyl-[acyl-carrier protein] reductase
MPEAVPIDHASCEMTDCRAVCDVLSPISSEVLHVINAAGRNIDGLIWNYGDEDVSRLLHDNITGAINVARAIMMIRPAAGSSLILLSSCVPRLGVRGASIYAAVKAGVSGMIRSLAHDFAPDYRVNAIELGYFAGGMIGDIDGERVEEIVNSIPLQRLGDAESIARTCEYLMRCTYATGGVIPLTGGL